MSQKILIATSNKGKKKELIEGFCDLEGFEFLDLSDFLPIEAPEEDGLSFEANALLKAQYYGEKLNMATLGEDSGLVLSAFPSKFGLKTRRELNAKDDMEWLTQFLDLMDGVPDRTAQLFSALAFFDPETHQDAVFLGITQGNITHFPQSPIEKGIPLSAVFLPNDAKLVFSALSKKEKEKISHRGQSMNKMKKFLQTLIQKNS